MSIPNEKQKDTSKFFAPENLRPIQLKYQADQIDAQIQYDRKLFEYMQRHKEEIRTDLATTGTSLLPTAEWRDRDWLCSWFAVKGLTCNKQVFLSKSCNSCFWEARLKPSWGWLTSLRK